jgi:hypothetical protein
LRTRAAALIFEGLLSPPDERPVKVWPAVLFLLEGAVRQVLQVRHREVLTLLSAVRVGTASFGGGHRQNSCVRQGACEAQVSSTIASAFSNLNWGQGLAVRLESLRAWIEFQQSMPCVFPYGRNLVTMGHVRRKPKLLPNKLVLIREDLGIVLVDMARKLEAGSSRLSNYENGNSEPTLMELLVYARLGKVHLESIVDDQVSVDSFRKLLGKQNGRTSGRT